MSEQYRQLPIEQLQEFILEPTKSREERNRELEQQLLSQGIIFEHFPEGVYPTMPYISSVQLAREGHTNYTRDYINKLANKEEIPAYHIGDGWILDPEGVEILLAREEQSLNRKTFPGRKPGSKGKRQS